MTAGDDRPTGSGTMRAFFVIPPFPFPGSMVRDLIYGCWCGGKRVGGVSFPPVPLAHLATLLRRAGIPARVIDAPAEGTPESGIASRLSRGDLLCCMSSPLSREIDVPFLERMRRKTGVRTVLFGAYPTFLPAEALEGDGVDFILRGEPESALVDLAVALRDGDIPAALRIPGVGSRTPDGVVLPAGRTRIPDLETLPHPDRTLLPDAGRYYNPVVRNRRFTTAFTSRGCSGNCTFCSSATFYGGRARYRSAESVLAEMEEIRASGYREIFFRDELFTGDKGRLATLCAEMPRRGLRFDWVCSTRVDRLDDDSARMMKSAGCHLVRMGVESGSPAVLDRIRKGITVEETARAFAACRKAGLDTHAHTMVGLPGETRDDFRMTLRLIREIRPTYFTVSVCTPYPGTALFDTLQGGRPSREPEGGYLPPNRKDGLFSVPVSGELSRIPSGEIPALLKQAYRDFYFQWDYIRRHLSAGHSPRRLVRKAIAGLAIASMVGMRD